jgi:uncharacterized membrane protein
MDAYRTIGTVKSIGRTAYYFWLALSVLFLAWLLLILTPPVAAAAGMTELSDGLYSFFGNICHQMPSRSFHLVSHKLGVCSRCFGVYFGLLAGALAYPLFREIAEVNPLPRIWLILAMFPIGIDWSLTYFGFWENTFFTRFVTGLILGAACAVFIIPALSELAQIYHMRKNRSQLENP